MQVVVDGSGTVTLADAGNFKSFSVHAAPGVDLTRALRGVAELEGAGHAWVREAWLLEQLGRQAPAADWQAGFAAMAAYARKKGWMREEPAAIRAHVELGA